MLSNCRRCRHDGLTLGNEFLERIRADEWAWDRGGLYPEGHSVMTKSAAGALERYHALKLACGRAIVRRDGHEVHISELMRLAREERFDQMRP